MHFAGRIRAGHKQGQIAYPQVPKTVLGNLASLLLCGILPHALPTGSRVRRPGDWVKRPGLSSPSKRECRRLYQAAIALKGLLPGSGCGRTRSLFAIRKRARSAMWASWERRGNTWPWKCMGDGGPQRFLAVVQGPISCLSFLKYRSPLGARSALSPDERWPIRSLGLRFRGCDAWMSFRFGRRSPARSPFVGDCPAWRRWIG